MQVNTNPLNTVHCNELNSLKRLQHFDKKESFLVKEPSFFTPTVATLPHHMQKKKKKILISYFLSLEIQRDNEHIPHEGWLYFSPHCSASQDMEFLLCHAGLGIITLSTCIAVHKNLRRGECDNLAAIPLSQDEESLLDYPVPFCFLVQDEEDDWQLLLLDVTTSPSLSGVPAGLWLDFSPPLRALKLGTARFEDWNAAVNWGLMGGERKLWRSCEREREEENIDNKIN